MTLADSVAAYLVMTVLTAIALWRASAPRRAAEGVAWIALSLAWPLVVLYVVYYIATGKRST